MTLEDGHSMFLAVIDAPVVSFGPQYAYPIPTNTTANPAYGVSSVLWDNLWGTNGLDSALHTWLTKYRIRHKLHHVVAVQQRGAGCCRRRVHPVPLYAVICLILIRE